MLSFIISSPVTYEPKKLSVPGVTPRECKGQKVNLREYETEACVRSKCGKRTWTVY
jgi:hypothetical protein